MRCCHRTYSALITPLTMAAMAPSAEPPWIHRPDPITMKWIRNGLPISLALGTGLTSARISHRPMKTMRPQVSKAASSERTEGGERIGRVQLVAVHAPGVEPGGEERIAQVIVARRDERGHGGAPGCVATSATQQRACRARSTPQAAPSTTLGPG